MVSPVEKRLGLIKVRIVTFGLAATVTKRCGRFLKAYAEDCQYLLELLEENETRLDAIEALEQENERLRDDLAEHGAEIPY